MRDETASAYWSSQAPVRLVLFFALTAYTYAMKSGELSLARFVPARARARAGQGVCTDVVFAWAFLEMMAWFWVSLGGCVGVAVLGVG
jgi:hypothetical protein